MLLDVLGDVVFIRGNFALRGFQAGAIEDHAIVQAADDAAARGGA
jgi:hypothetical protein